MNQVILSNENLVIKRLWNPTTNNYEARVVDLKTNRLMELFASRLLRCENCIKYHLGKAKESRVTKEDLYKVFAVANIVVLPIVVTHTRRTA